MSSPPLDASRIALVATASMRLTPRFRASIVKLRMTSIPRTIASGDRNPVLKVSSPSRATFLCRSITLYEKSGWTSAIIMWIELLPTSMRASLSIYFPEGVANNLPFYHIHDELCHIGGVVGDALQVLGNKGNSEGPRDSLRILDHEREQFGNELLRQV